MTWFAGLITSLCVDVAVRIVRAESRESKQDASETCAESLSTKLQIGVAPGDHWVGVRLTPEAAV